MFKRLKTLLQLSKVDISYDTSKGVTLDFKKVIEDLKPRGQAMIVEDSPLEQFPTEEPEMK